MPNTHTIKIIGGSPGNGKLRAQNGWLTKASAGDIIVWEIQPNPQVVAIILITPKEFSDTVFSSGPTRISDIKWEATINPNGPSDCLIYNYEIKWKASNNMEPVYDPIISIKPSSRFSGVVGTVVGFVTGTIVTAVLWRMDRLKCRKENERLVLENKSLKKL